MRMNVLDLHVASTQHYDSFISKLFIIACHYDSIPGAYYAYLFEYSICIAHGHAEVIILYKFSN